MVPHVNAIETWCAHAVALLHFHESPVHQKIQWMSLIHQWTYSFVVRWARKRQSTHKDLKWSHI
jgi:hypothetical protein